MSIGTLRPEQGPPTFPLELIESDGVPLETDWHRLAMTLLIELTHALMTGETDYFVGGNMFVYFNSEKKRDQDFRGPDYFFVRGVDAQRHRLYWAVWEEGGKFPDVLMEFGSKTTLKEDETVKKELYEKSFRTPEYFIFDPFENLLKGWRLVGDRYERIVPNKHGWLWSEQLGCWLGNWEGEYLNMHYVYPRFYDEDERLIPTADERARLEKARADKEQQKAVAERKKARDEKQRAEAEKQRADDETRKVAEERKRADAAEAEIARLKALLENGKQGQT